MFRKRKWTITFITVAVLILYPFQTTIVPEQRALFVTNDTHPIKGALIRQSWQNYSLERVGHEEDLPHRRSRAENKEIVGGILAVLALWKGLRTYARVLIDFSEDEVCELDALATGNAGGQL